MAISGEDTDAKLQHRMRLLDYLSNPENEWPRRSQYCDCIRISNSALHQFFTPDELLKVDAEALAIRRGQYHKVSAKVDKALEEAATEGTAADRKLYYQVKEGWSEKVDVSIPDSVNIKINKPPA